MTTRDESCREILVDDARGARVTYHPGYVPRDQANLLLARMMAAPWQREAPIIFGKAREVRRRTCAIGDEGLVYRYSGLDRVALPWPDELVPVLERLRADFDRRLNFGLCNLYPDGDAAIGKHADAESDIVRDSPTSASRSALSATSSSSRAPVDASNGQRRSRSSTARSWSCGARRSASTSTRYLRGDGAASRA